MKKALILLTLLTLSNCASRYRYQGGYSQEQQAWSQALGNIGGQLAAPASAPMPKTTTCNPNAFGGFSCFQH